MIGSGPSTSHPSSFGRAVCMLSPISSHIMKAEKQRVGMLLVSFLDWVFLMNDFSSPSVRISYFYTRIISRMNFTVPLSLRCCASQEKSESFPCLLSR